MKKLILNIIIQVLYRYSKKTPAYIKSSNRNLLVAKATLAVLELKKNL